MLKLHGFPSSNYYNVAKLALLEKGIEFEEILCFVGAGEEYNPEYLDKSPMGKVPALETQFFSFDSLRYSSTFAKNK